MPERLSPFGRYTLLEPIGSGGMGAVWLARAHDPAFPSPVVIKILHEALGRQEGFVKRFRHEAEVAARVRSPHLPQLFDAGEAEGSCFLVMEHVPGWSLARILDDHRAAGARVSLRSVVDLGRGACRALTALHEGVDPATGAPLGFIHRDVTPSNLLLGEDGRARLIDFGLGASNLQDWKTEAGVVMGSPGYMAPEQVRGQALDQTADIYALGLVLWEMLTLEPYVRRGAMPSMLRRQADPELRRPSELRSDVPAALESTLLRALAPDSSARFRTAREMASALDASLPDVTFDEGEMLSTLVGDMLWGELVAAKTEVTQLLARAPEAEDTDAEAQESFILPTVAAPDPPRPGITPARLPGADLGFTPTPLVQRVETLDFHGGGSPLGSSTWPPEPPRRGVSPLLTVALMGLTLAVGLGGGAWLSAGGGSVEPAPIAVPDRAAIPASVRPSASAQPTPTEVSPAPEVPAPAPPSQTEPRRRRPVRAAPVLEEASAAAQAPSRSLDAQLLDLLRAARSLRRDSAGGDAAAADALVAAISREMGAPTVAGVTRLGDELERLRDGAP